MTPLRRRFRPGGTLLRKLRSFYRLPAIDRRRVRRAMVTLLGVSWGLRTLGLSRCQRWLGRRLPAPRSADLEQHHQLITDWEWAVRLAARNAPCRARCLEQSLTLWYLLARLGIDGALRIGVRKADAQTMEAHAWVEVAGQPVNDREDIARTYLPFEGPLPSAVDLR